MTKINTIKAKINIIKTKTIENTENMELKYFVKEKKYRNFNIML